MDTAGITNVRALGAGGANQRERFHLELTPGQTNIVSLKKLRRQAGEEVSDDSSEDEAERYIFVKLPRKERSGAVVTRNTVVQPNTGRIEHSEPSNDRTKRKGKELIIDPVCEEDEVLLRKASVPLTGATRSGDESLEQSILQLKNLVEHSKIPLIDVQGGDASLLDIEKQLSPELKKNLAEIARSTQLIEGKISKELINRLMGILGNYLKGKTLKKIMREMILEDLYASKAKCISFKHIKNDLVKMIRLEAPSSNLKVYPNSKLGKGTYSMSDQLEDKLYNVYDTFCQGLYKDIGPSLIRRLYVKLAELWPNDTMDKNEIREAICRARERRMGTLKAFKQG